MTCEASEEETFYGSTMGRRRGLVHISCELFLACVFVSSRDAPTLAITTTDLKPSGYIVSVWVGVGPTMKDRLRVPAGLMGPTGLLGLCGSVRVRPL